MKIKKMYVAAVAAVFSMGIVLSAVAVNANADNGGKPEYTLPDYGDAIIVEPDTTIDTVTEPVAVNANTDNGGKPECTLPDYGDAIVFEPNTTIDTVSEPIVSEPIVFENADYGICEQTTIENISPEDLAAPANVSSQVTRTLSSGDKYETQFDLSGLWGQPDHNRVRFSIEATGTYTINLWRIDGNEQIVIVNGERHTDDYGFTLLGYADDTYKFSIVNPGAKDLTFTLTITSYYQE